MTNSVSRAKDEKLRIELLQTIFKFKKLANSGLGMRPLDGKQDISLAEFMLLRAVDNNSADSPSNVSPTDIGQFLSVTKGAVSQMLHSLEEKELIRSYEKDEGAARPRRYYHLERKGQHLLREKEVEWATFTTAVDRVLKGGVCLGSA